MEKKIGLRFHVFKIKNIATLILVEPKKNEYVWVYLYLEKSLRNGTISSELAKYALYILKGQHHIHWFAKLKSFQLLSKEFNWKTKSKSDIFLGCKYSITRNLTNQSNFHLLFHAIVNHKVTNKKPNSLIYKNREQEKLILSTIKEMFLV